MGICKRKVWKHVGKDKKRKIRKEETSKKAGKVVGRSVRKKEKGSGKRRWGMMVERGSSRKDMKKGSKATVSSTSFCLGINA